MVDATEKITINSLPVPTWNWLKMNDAKIDFSGKSFTKAEAQIRNIPDGVKYSSNVNSDGGVDMTRVKKIETGTGADADKYFSGGSPCIFLIEKNCSVAEPVVLNFELADGANVSAAQIIYAKENSRVTVIIVSKSEKSSAGFQALRTYCVAEKNAKIHLVKVQLLGDGFSQIDDTGAQVAENANVTLTQIMLGASECFAGATATLTEHAASFKSDTAYLCAANQKLDMNYVVRHIAKKTSCEMHVSGTLRDKAQKTYRGSIDFVKGCSGSVGVETEETLLLSPDAQNKSIPLILCGEEDVSGEHGASIGRLGEDILFYMKSRGITRKTAEDMMSFAKIYAVSQLIPDSETVQLIESYIDD